MIKVPTLRKAKDGAPIRANSKGEFGRVKPDGRQHTLKQLAPFQGFLTCNA